MVLSFSADDPVTEKLVYAFSYPYLLGIEDKFGQLISEDQSKICEAKYQQQV